MEIDKIFIDCLKQPVFARVKYLEAEQVKSNFSKMLFLEVLYNKWQEYRAIVFKSDLEKPFVELVKTKGWEYAAITVYGDEPEPFEHIYSEIELKEIETENIFKNTNQNSFEWLNENILWLLRVYIYRLYDKWDLLSIEGPGTIKEFKPPQQTETKTDKLKIELGKYGFFELSKVKQLSEPNKQRLTELINTNDLPYSIAMFEYLGFLKHLKAEHFKTDYKLFKAVANWFEVNERAVKGNIYVLNEISKENRTRYTADQQKQKVQKDYEALK
jgi:hypothetical protein